jgi:hypothetical protein
MFKLHRAFTADIYIAKITRCFSKVCLFVCGEGSWQRLAWYFLSSQVDDMHSRTKTSDSHFRGEDSLIRGL